ncbi:ComF family protein [Polaribacter sp. R2A056_3_33]|jgi:ComF family protein|uniref:ComF family protein n=1 Tax=Polaribacter sp. R2A056_3_33 TaxID=2745563 RepID=UPI001C4FC6AD|nr:ComF family protein [Polaribacter sp. R2A056_3_33]QXP71376.1 ComF family protein [Polaribacter sp. R2A056_3_33]
MRILKDLFNLFYPKLCANCDNQLTKNENAICTFCRHDLPLTNFTNYSENKITKTFYGRITIEKAYSLLFYRKIGITKKLIHELKYKGNEEIGMFFGNWLGEMLIENNEFSAIDVIVPVPLHPKKRRERGYNQVSKFGESLSNHLNKTFVEDILLRTSSSKTQTFKARFERFNNNDTKFQLSNITALKNKHILLIDDVITTGATLEACAKELQKTEGVKISILTMAYTE